MSDELTEHQRLVVETVGDAMAQRARADRLEAEVKALREAGKDAIDCLNRVLHQGQPFSFSQRDEVRLAIESLGRALEGPGDRGEG